MKLKKFAPSGVLFLIFIIYTLVVKYADVAPIGPNGSKVGLSTVNGFFAGLFKYNEFFYDITKVVAVFSFLFIGFFALLGLIQLIKGKSFKKVDPAIYGLGGLYIITVLFYALFEVLIINYRPILTDGELEASFPSSHTMLAISVLGSAIIYFIYRLKNEKPFVIANLILIAIMTVGRLVSGVHWFTDIIGGVILGCALVSLYFSYMIVIHPAVESK